MKRTFFFIVLVLYVACSYKLETVKTRVSETIQIPTKISRLGGIFGRVIEKRSHRPLSGVSVVVEGARFETSSDNSGYYELPGLPTGDYDIVFMKEKCDTVVVESFEMNIGEKYKIDVALTFLHKSANVHASYDGGWAYYPSARVKKEEQEEFPPTETEKKEIKKLPEAKTVTITDLNVSEDKSQDVLEDKEKKTTLSMDREHVFDSISYPLKAAAHNDNEEYPSFLEYLDSFGHLGGVYHHVFKDRFIVRITDGQDRPVWNVPFRIVDERGQGVWESVSYANGENIVYPHIMFDPDSSGHIFVEVDSEFEKIREPLSETFQRITTLRLLTKERLEECALDLLFILDTTGSMDDEIQQLKDTIYSIYTRIHGMFSSVSIRFGLILYRDREDEYVVENKGFTEDIDLFQVRVDRIEADGGGDYREDVQAALREAIEETPWNPDAMKIAFLIADAPPHLDYRQRYNYVRAALEANRKGIKLFTIGASGLDPEGEYTFRQVSALTYGEFIFLTYGEEGESEGTGKGKVSHHTGDNYESHDLDDLVVNIVRKEISYQLPVSRIAYVDMHPRYQANYLIIRMNNLWKQIGKQVGEFLDDKPVGILAPFEISETRLDTLARFLQEISVVSLIESQSISLVERDRLEELLDERRLALTGLLETKDYDEIALLSGANVIFLGKVEYAGVDRVVFMRAVKTSDSQIIGAARIRL